VLERSHQRILRQFLGLADVAHDARDGGDDAGRFDAPDRIDGSMQFIAGAALQSFFS
jgi:hypothetical protein